MNRTISAEATEELLRNDHFVLVSYQWPSLGSIIHKFDVPIITEDQVACARFKQYSIRLNLRHRDVPVSKTLQEKKGASKGRAFLMLVRDMVFFCRMIRWICFGKLSACMMVLKEKEVAGEVKDCFQTFANNGVKKRFSMVAEINEGILTRASALKVKDLEGMFFNVIRDIRITGQKVRVHGSVGTSEMREGIAHFVGSEIVFLTAFAWDMVDTLLALVAVSRQLIGYGDIPRALDRLDNILDACVEQCQLLSLPEEVYSSDATEPVVLFIRFLVEVATVYGFLVLAEGKIALARKMEELAHMFCSNMSEYDDRQDILGYKDQPQATWLLKTAYWHLESLLMLASDSLSPLEVQSVVERLRNLKEIQPESAHVAHDYELLQSTPSDAPVVGGMPYDPRA